MTDIIFGLALLLAFELKHLLADYFFQPSAWMTNKHRYMSSGGVKHALFHGVLTALVLLLFDVPVVLSLSLAFLEAVLHYHIDWIKAGLTKVRGWRPSDVTFWRAFGFDQLLHKLTYMAIVFITV